MGKRTVTVIIPTYKPGASFGALLDKLEGQSILPDRILVVNTEESLFKPELIAGHERVEVLHITRAAFDHGGTRDMAARRCDTQILMFMTMDAVPADDKLIEKMLAPFDDPQVGAVYGRQLPAADCGVIERLTRSWNYGEESRKKTSADLPQLGIKTFFCSDVCAAYRADMYVQLGGFEKHTIFNEDMIFASKLIDAGYAVYYQAKARVIHSHNYSAMQQFHRNFDLGVSQADHPEVFERVPSEGEGARMVKQTARELIASGRPDQIIRLVWQSGWKLLGYKAGKNYKKLPRALVLRFTMNREYWRV